MASDPSGILVRILPQLVILIDALKASELAAVASHSRPSRTLAKSVKQPQFSRQILRYHQNLRRRMT